MIRIRPGRSWRHNPAYLRDLRAGTGGADILDVLGIEVDGVDIAAGVGEAQVLVAVAELAQALQHLAEGEPAAQATIGPGPTELVLESRGHDLLLTLVTREWIELLFRVDPDHGSGSLEWLVVVAALVATVTFSVLARLEWQRAQEVTS